MFIFSIYLQRDETKYNWNLYIKSNIIVASFILFFWSLDIQKNYLLRAKIERFKR